MRHLHLPALRQQLWTALHYPFHLSLVLFMQGFTQLILWGKAFNVFNRIAGGWLFDLDPSDPSDLTNMTSRALASSLANRTGELFTLYPPKYSEASAVVNASIANISTIPDTLWPKLQDLARTGNESVLDDTSRESLFQFGEQAAIIVATLANSVLTSFNIDLATELKKKHPGDPSAIKSSENQLILTDRTLQRSRLIVRLRLTLQCFFLCTPNINVFQFAYTYVACGCALILLVLMALVSRMAPLGRLPRLRFIVCALVGVGIGLTAVLFFAPNKTDDFLQGPWPIPTILFGWFLATVLVHLRGGSRARSALDTVKNVFSLFRPRRRRRSEKVTAEAEERREEDADSQRVALRFWAPTRENTGLSAAGTLQNAGDGQRPLSLRPLSSNAGLGSEPPSPRSKDPDLKFLEPDGSNQV